jgi:hypothetical protein
MPSSVRTIGVSPSADAAAEEAEHASDVPAVENRERVGVGRGRDKQLTVRTRIGSVHA